MDAQVCSHTEREEIRTWKSFAIVCLILTMLTGVILRLSFAGVDTGFLKKLDLRQAHSHLGFYGFLFPMIWVLLRSRSFWIPQGGLALFYKVSVAVSFFAFLVQGYGAASHAASILVLLIWLVFSIKNLKNQHPMKKSWDGAIPVSVILATMFVAAVAISAARGFDNLAFKFVRGFLTVLAYGVFLPSILSRFLPMKVPAWLWILGTLGLAVFASDIFPVKMFAWGPLALSAILFLGIRKTIQSPFTYWSVRSIVYILLLSFSLILFAFEALKNTHFITVSGMHFLILGTIVGHFLIFQKFAAQLFYDLVVGTMVVALLLMEFFSQYFIYWQWIAAGSGAALMGLLLCHFFKCLIMAKQDLYDLDHISMIEQGVPS